MAIEGLHVVVCVAGHGGCHHLLEGFAGAEDVAVPEDRGRGLAVDWVGGGGDVVCVQATAGRLERGVEGVRKGFGCFEGGSVEM